MKRLLFIAIFVASYAWAVPRITPPPGAGGGAPTTAQYWVGAADASLSAEKDLSALSTGLVVNTAGTPSAYAGTSCTNQFPRSLSASGAATCASVADTDFSGSLSIGKGGSGVTARSLNGVNIGTGTNTVSEKTLPSCSNATTSKLLYDNSTQTFSCGTDQTAAGSGTLIRLTTNDFTNSTTTPSTIISTSVAANTEYGFYCVIVGQGTATSLPRYNINGPTANNVSFVTQRHTSTSAQTLLVLQAFSAAVQTAACTSSCNTTNLPTQIFGSFTTTASGTFALQGTSSTSGQTITVRRGTYCVLY